MTDISTRLTPSADLLRRIPRGRVSDDRFDQMVEEAWALFESGVGFPQVIKTLKDNIVSEEGRLGAQALPAPAPEGHALPKEVSPPPPVVGKAPPEAQPEPVRLKPGVLLRRAGGHDGISLDDALEIAGKVLNEGLGEEDALHRCRAMIKAHREELERKRLEGLARKAREEEGRINAMQETALTPAPQPPEPDGEPSPPWEGSPAPEAAKEDIAPEGDLAPEPERIPAPPSEAPPERDLTAPYIELYFGLIHQGRTPEEAKAEVLGAFAEKVREAKEARNTAVREERRRQAEKRKKTLQKKIASFLLRQERHWGGKIQRGSITEEFLIEVFLRVHKGKSSDLTTAMTSVLLERTGGAPKTNGRQPEPEPHPKIEALARGR